MKPSLYFKDCFRYSLKKFASKESLLQWFKKQAGETSETFEYPLKLSDNQNVLIILPDTAEEVALYFPFLQKISKIKKHGVLLLANSLFENLIQTNQVKQEVLYYTTLGCRFGEDEFQKLKEVIQARQIKASFYLQRQTLFQMLYLCKSCGIPYRFGFDCENFYPLLNLSLIPGEDFQKQIEALEAIFEGAVQ
ncbi:MAG: hypothetical protein J6Z31_06915 [Fibrobacter sp.]|nr:hypothetical protein [Fibrobacter sp.]